MEDDKLYISHILDAITDIQKYVGRLTFKQFMSVNRMVIRDAVVRKLEIIGEATKHFSEKFKKEYSGIPWKEIVGMRDNLIHEYFDVAWDIVWSTVKKDLPPLKDHLQIILKQSSLL